MKINILQPSGSLLTLKAQGIQYAPEGLAVKSRITDLTVDQLNTISHRYIDRQYVVCLIGQEDMVNFEVVEGESK